MVTLQNHEKVGPDYHLFFVDPADHEELVAWAVEQHMDPVVYDEESSYDEAGVWVCPNSDDDGYEWHFIGRNKEAMLFKLKVT